MGWDRVRTAALQLGLLGLLLNLSGCGLVMSILRFSTQRSDDPATLLEGDDPGECTDGIDNDDNGKTDCKEPFCRHEPECDPARIAEVRRAAHTEKIAAKVGGTYAVSCDRERLSSITINAGACSFQMDDCTGPKPLACSLRETPGLYLVGLRDESSASGMDQHELRMKIVDPNTLVVDANRLELCRCGPTPRLVFKRVEGAPEP